MFRPLHRRAFYLCMFGGLRKLSVYWKACAFICRLCSNWRVGEGSDQIRMLFELRKVHKLMDPPFLINELKVIFFPYFSAVFWLSMLYVCLRIVTFSMVTRYRSNTHTEGEIFCHCTAQKGASVFNWPFAPINSIFLYLVSFSTCSMCFWALICPWILQQINDFQQKPKYRNFATIILKSVKM